MSDLPAWAITAAREAIAKQDAHESLSQAVARALVAERERAARETRNADLAAIGPDRGPTKREPDGTPYLGSWSQESCYRIISELPLLPIAAAIRNQEPAR